MLSEYKNKILTKEIPSIMDEYFSNLDKILQKYLTPQILQKQHNQMAQLLYYNAILIEDWVPLLEDSKQKFRFGIGYAKKALDLAIQADKVDEFVNQIKSLLKMQK
ncbi:hypothetical protein C1646_756394 [Rhizophagus diaphanus]|nr:hypothetical protein C1646_756394 [Rhizophagus diaphanus] [Rhizophagus sp. MUCL 43196]